MHIAPKPKELKYREQMVDSEFYGAHANSAEMGGEDRPVTHKESSSECSQNRFIFTYASEISFLTSKIEKNVVSFVSCSR